MTPSQDETADWAGRTEQALLDAFLLHVAARGWTQAAIDRAAADIGISCADAALLCGNGPRDLAALFSRRLDGLGLDALKVLEPGQLKIRERIFKGVEARLEAAAAYDKAARSWTGFLALPVNVPLGLRLTWATADGIWRWAGDVATDENHYSKRAILSGILIPALNIRLAEDKAAADAFVANRIENVMQFEKWKAGLKKPSETAGRVAGVLARMRYGATARTGERGDAPAG